MYERTRFISEGAEWPPNIPKLIVSVALIHYKGKRTQLELFEMANIYKEGAPAIDRFAVSSTYQEPSAKKPQLDYSRVTKNITDIFAADPTDLIETGTSSTKTPKRILIEGAPGIGKTVLAKEIAYQWATNEILTEIKIVFLLYLRDPRLQLTTSTEQLVEYMSMGSLNNEQIKTFDKYLVNTKGQELCIVMDGFDEWPTLSQQNSFIVKIIKGIVLPEAIVVITSRPTATVSLHDRVDRRIDILGLPKEERDKYISRTFSNSPERKVELDRYLKQQPVINGLCFVPLHLAILLYLFLQDSLPETLTEMNESFILHTIYRHLKKHGKTPSGAVDKLAKVPKAILDIIHKLSELAFKGLQENKLVFTFDEIKEVCPHFDETVGAINGFGLLQAVEHYPHKGAGTTTSFNFLHYTMQEFLAALHVSNLPSEQQSSLIKNTFWDGRYNFMWMMFVGIVGIKSDIFVNFISEGKVHKRKSGIKMAESILSDKRKRLHVFQCYMEAKSSTEAPDVIFDMFKDGKVIINGVELLPHHISSLMIFMFNSSMQWKTLELKQCNITDGGMSILQQLISEKLSTLKYVDLSNYNSSPWGVYCAIIRYCSVNSLTLCGDHGIEDYVNEIKEGLQMNTRLISLTLCNITNNGAITIAEAIQVNTTLQKLNIAISKISDDAVAAISDCLKFNTSLQELNISHRCITNKGIRKISQAIQINPTLLNISRTHISIAGLVYFMEAVKNNRTLQVVNITHNNVTRSGFTSIKQCIENLQHPIQIYASWNEIISRNGELLVISKFCTFQESENIIEDEWSFEDYDHDHVMTCLSECLKEDDTLLELNMSKNQIIRGREKKIIEAIKENKTLLKLDASFIKIQDEDYISDCLKINKSLKELNMSENMITSNGAKEIATAIRVNTTLEKLDLSCNRISNDGVSFISDGLQFNTSLQELNISYNCITNKGIKEISEAIQMNSTLQNIDISKNLISIEGLVYFMEAVNNNCTLQVVNITHNNVTRSGFTSIKQCIENLQHPIQIYASWNEIISRNGELLVISKICTFQESENIIEDEWSFEDYDHDHVMTCLSECLKEDDTLLELNMSKNQIIRGREKKIIEAIKENKTLLKLDASFIKIQDEDYISDCLKINKSLKELNMSENMITSNGAKEIATAIRVNTTLEKLDLSCNRISNDGVSFISDGLQFNTSLQELNISYNCITNKGIKEITEAIQMNSTLQNIDISKNLISIEGLVYFMEAVNNNCTLQVVNITHNNVTRSGFTSIKQCIENLQRPIQIYASWNEINNKGKLVTKISTSCAPDNIEDDVWSFNVYNADHLVMCLSECLKEDDTLQELNISNSKITSEGANMIAEAIKVNKILKKLDIRGNSISDDGAAAISNGLKCNISLQELDMSFNKITSKGAKLIAEAIKINRTLHTLYLWQYDINYALSFNMTVLTAVYHNSTIMTLTLPRVYNDDERLVSEVEKINKERTRQGISTLTCDY